MPQIAGKEEYVSHTWEAEAQCDPRLSLFSLTLSQGLNCPLQGPGAGGGVSKSLLRALSFLKGEYETQLPVVHSRGVLRNS